MTKRALIIAHKFLNRAPRPLKEIVWLQDESWVVDTIGLGDAPPINGHHQPMKLPSFLIRAFYYFLPNMKLRFDGLYGQFFPKKLSLTLETYDLIIVHDLALLPLPQIREEVLRRSGKGFIIDLHENHVESLSRGGLEEFVFGKYRKWEYSQFQSLVAATSNGVALTAVSDEIASAYKDSVGVMPTVLRNTPAFVDQEPSNVDSQKIRLVHHGVGTNYRGIEESIQAMKHLPPNFSLTFYLVSSQLYLLKLKLLVLLAGVKTRVRFMNPVPTRQLAIELNKYDLALVVIPPVTVNSDQAVPNKLLESIQGRLGIIVGPNSAMSKIVREHGLGKVLNGWGAADIVNGLSGISREEIVGFKKNSAGVSDFYSANLDGKVFRALIENQN